MISDFSGLLSTAFQQGEKKIHDETKTFGVLLKKCQEQINQEMKAGDVILIRREEKYARLAREVIYGFLDRAYNEYAALPEPGYEWPELDIDELTQRIFSMMFGLGPINKILETMPEVEDIALNGPNEVMIRTAEGWQAMPPREVRDLNVDPEMLLFMFNQTIQLSSSQTAGHLNPIVDDQLPAGHRLSLVTDPVISNGLGIGAVIRKHRPITFTIDDFLQTPVKVYPAKEVVIPDYSSGWAPTALLTPSAATFLHMCVYSGLNILLIGATGVGKTSFLSMLGRFIPLDRRVLVLEDTRELNLRPGETPQNCIYLTTVTKKLEGGVDIGMSDLVKLALRQRPDHLVLGEARGGEMWDLLGAMQTGHGGNLTSLHAISAEDLMQRVSFMVDQADTKTDLSSYKLAKLLGTSFHVVITLLLDWRGRRHVKEIGAFTGEVSKNNEPEIETLFQGGEAHDFILKLEKTETALEPFFSKNGLSFKLAVEQSKREKI